MESQRAGAPAARAGTVRNQSRYDMLCSSAATCCDNMRLTTLLHRVSPCQPGLIMTAQCHPADMTSANR